MARDRRHDIRIDFEDELPGKMTVVEPVRVAQISTTGAQVDITAPLQVGTLHDLRLTLDGRPVVVKGRVVHSAVRHVHREQVLYRTGIEFVDLGGAASRAIGDFVDGLLSRRIANDDHVP